MHPLGKPQPVLRREGSGSYRLQVDAANSAPGLLLSPLPPLANSLQPRTRDAEPRPHDPVTSAPGPRKGFHPQGHRQQPPPPHA